MRPAGRQPPAEPIALQGANVWKCPVAKRVFLCNNPHRKEREVYHGRMRANALAGGRGAGYIVVFASGRHDGSLVVRYVFKKADGIDLGCCTGGGRTASRSACQGQRRPLAVGALPPGLPMRDTRRKEKKRVSLSKNAIHRAAGQAGQALQRMDQPLAPAGTYHTGLDSASARPVRSGVQRERIGLAPGKPHRV